MIPRLFVFFAIAGLGWSTGAVAQTTCPNGALPCAPNGPCPSAAGICPVFVQGDPTCEEAAQICSIKVNQDPVIFSPVISSTRSGITLRVVGTTVDVKDNTSTPDQQSGRPGFDAAIIRRNSAYVYCGNGTIHDIYTAPGRQTPNQVTICFAKGPCGLSPENVTNACNVYNSAGVTANFLQAYKVGPIQQEINICGCSPFVARFCELRTPALDEDGNPRFVACNQDSSPLKSVEAEGTATIGTNSCILRSIGGRRVLIDSATGQLC